MGVQFSNINFDTIIVGGGSAGCVLAERLSEDPIHKVLLIEAGPDYPEKSTIPSDILNSYAITYSHDWGYMSQPGRQREVYLSSKIKSYWRLFCNQCMLCLARCSFGL